MRINKALLFTLAFLGMPYQASASGFKDFLEKTKDTIEKTTGEIDEKLSTDKDNDKEATLVETDLKGMPLPAKAAETVDRHGYEDALSVSDQTCAEIVDPFNLSDNSTRIIAEVVKNDGIDLVTNAIAGGNQENARNGMLDTAKIRAKQLNWLPMEQEVAYGRKLHQQRLEEDKNVIVRTDKGRVKRLYQNADELLQKILAGIDETHPYQFELLLVDNGDINAAALPGGFLHINSGVLESNHAELVLGHEIGHVFKRHQTRETQARLIDTVATLEDLKSLLDAEPQALDQHIERTTALYGSFQNYSRQQELQADACAVRMAARIPEIQIDQMIDSYVDSLAASAPAATAGDQTADVQQTAPLDRPLEDKYAGHPAYPERKQRMKEVSKQLMATTSLVRG